MSRYLRIVPFPVCFARILTACVAVFLVALMGICPATAAPAGDDELPPAQPLLGVLPGAEESLAHEALGHAAYRQTQWTSAPPMRLRLYEARDPATPLQHVELETCQTDGRVIAVRIFGPDTRAFGAAAHRKFSFHFAERARNEERMDSGPRTDIPFVRHYADDVVLRLHPTSEGGELTLENTSLRQDCTETFVEARQRMEHFFYEQDQARVERRSDEF